MCVLLNKNVRFTYEIWFSWHGFQSYNILKITFEVFGNEWFFFASNDWSIILIFTNRLETYLTLMFRSFQNFQMLKANSKIFSESIHKKFTHEWKISIIGVLEFTLCLLKALNELLGLFVVRWFLAYDVKSYLVLRRKVAG